MRIPPSLKKWLAGKIVQFSGNTWQLDSLTYSLASRAISTDIRSRFFFNTYEDKERRLVMRYVPPNLPVVEAGGCIGVISCLVNHQLNDPTKHIVVEPHQLLVELIVQNGWRNGCQFSVIPRALSTKEDRIPFHVSANCLASSIVRETDTTIMVPTISLHTIIQKYEFNRIVLILDIEGAELDTIQQEKITLANHVALLILETHGNHKEVIPLLEDIDFVLAEKDADTYVFYNSRLARAAPPTVQ